MSKRLQTTRGDVTAPSAERLRLYTSTCLWESLRHRHDFVRADVYTVARGLRYSAAPRSLHHDGTHDVFTTRDAQHPRSINSYMHIPLARWLAISWERGQPACRMFHRTSFPAMTCLPPRSPAATSLQQGCSSSTSICSRISGLEA